MTRLALLRARASALSLASFPQRRTHRSLAQYVMVPAFAERQPSRPRKLRPLPTEAGWVPPLPTAWPVGSPGPVPPELIDLAWLVFDADHVE